MPVSAICSTCGTSFPTFPSRLKAHNFCSRSCADAAQSTVTNRRTDPWSDREILLVREYYQSLGPAGCLPLLPGRGKKQIITLAQKLGLKSDRAPAVGMTDAWVRRFWRRVDKDGVGGCWIWTGNISGHGYGTVRFTPEAGVHKSLGTHRVAWELTNGPVPAGKMVLHSCRNRRCCNPAHLRAGTAQDNMDDRTKDGQTCRGELSGNAKLVEGDVVEIRRMVGEGIPLRSYKPRPR